MSILIHKLLLLYLLLKLILRLINDFFGLGIPSSKHVMEDQLVYLILDKYLNLNFQGFIFINTL